MPDFLRVPWGIRDLLWFVAGWIGAQILLGLLLAILGPLVPAVGQFLTMIERGDIQASFSLVLIDAMVGLGLVARYLRKYDVNWSAVGWRRVNLGKALAYLVGIMIAFMIVANVLLFLVQFLVPGFDANQAQENEFIGASESHRSLALVALVLLPPVLEETIFRGFLFPALSKRWGVVAGAVISSILFGIAHWQANIGVYTFVLGLLLCFMYVRLRSIVPGILLHMLNNYLAFLAMAGR